jgi:hypothetical protein
MTRDEPLQMRAGRGEQSFLFARLQSTVPLGYLDLTERLRQGGHLFRQSTKRAHRGEVK